MPYKKKYTKKSYKSYAGTAYNVSKKALTIALMTKKLLNVEFKQIETPIQTQAVSTTATIIQLTNILQGNSNLTRDGDQIKLTALLFKYFYVINSSATSTALRVMIVQDKQTNNAIYTIGSLLEDSTADDAIVSPLNLNNKYRFRVLYDKVHIVNISGSQKGYRKIFKKLDLKIRYGANAGTIADVRSDSLSIVLISDEATNTIVLNGHCRLRFVDN